MTTPHARRRVRIAHLVSHPIPYFAPLYRELSRRPGVDLTVYFYSDATVRDFTDPEFGRDVRWDTDLLSGYDHRFLPSASHTPTGGPFLRRPNLDIVRELLTGSHDALWLHGYQHLTTWLAAAAARARNTPVLIRDEQTLLHGRPIGRRILKEVALRALYAQSSALYIGEENRRYFAHYGMPPDRMYAAPYCVDNTYFTARAEELRPQRDDIRRAFGISGDRPVVLFAGKLIEKKQPLLLIEAFARVRATQPCALLIAGDGPLRAEAEALVARLGVPDARFAGFLNQSELPRAYAAADVFVLPSSLHETWGLVVNEAMNFDLPVVVSNKVGCARDLVRPGENGFVFRHDSAEQLADILDILVADAGLRGRLGEESRRIIANYSIERAVDGIVAAATAAKEGAAWTQHEAIAA